MIVEPGQGINLTMLNLKPWKPASKRRRRIMSNRPRCQICGKFISDDDLVDGDKVGFEIVWTEGSAPELDYDIFWHLTCEGES